MKYRKKPVIIEAIPLEIGEASRARIQGFTNGLAQPAPGGCMSISTLEGTHLASVGDYIIKGVKGEFYPCKPDIFAATYEPVKDAVLAEAVHELEL